MQASNHDDQAATAFIARFTQRTLRALSMESRPASPVQAPADVAAVLPDQPDFLVDLVSFPSHIVASKLWPYI
jgi:hypothetical protein